MYHFCWLEGQGLVKKIVFVIRHLYGGGAERVTAALANELCKGNEYQVHIILFSRDKSCEYPLDDRVFCHSMEVQSHRRIQAIAERCRYLRKVIDSIDPYCIISLDGIRSIVLTLVSIIGKKRFVVLSERNDPRSHPSSKILRLLRLWAYSICTGVVFQTNEAKSFFPKFIRKKSAVICNPITSKLPDPYKGRREKRIVNFCRLVPQKNLDLLIDAFSDIYPFFPEYSLHIYGDGGERERLQIKIEQMGLQDKIILHGYSNNIYEDINQAALFVSSSNYEGISNSMLEAIALGIPCICTDCPAGGARDVIKHGYNGMLVAVGDRNGLSEMMKEVLSNVELSESLSQGGLVLRNEICVSEITKKWIEAMESFVDKKS